MNILFHILTALNALFFVLAQLYVWRPMTFKKLYVFNRQYAFVVLFPLAIITVIRFVRRHHAQPNLTDITIEMYSLDLRVRTRRQFIYNAIACVIYAAILIHIF